MNLSPLPIQKFFDNNGRPLVGGLLFIYEAVSTTKVATYSDQAGTLNTNPVVLDYRGECRVWLDPLLTYKFVLSPEGDTDPPTKPIWTVDMIASGLTFADLTQIFIGGILYPPNGFESGISIAKVWLQYYTRGRYGSFADWLTVCNAAGAEGSLEQDYAILADTELPNKSDFRGFKITGAFKTYHTDYNSGGYVHNWVAEFPSIRGCYFCEYTGIKSLNAVGKLLVEGHGNGTYWCKIGIGAVRNLEINCDTFQVNQNTFYGGVARYIHVTGGAAGTGAAHANQFIGIDVSPNGDGQPAGIVQDDESRLMNRLMQLYYDAGVDVIGNWAIDGFQADENSPPRVDRFAHVWGAIGVNSKTSRDYPSIGIENLILGGNWDVLTGGTPPGMVTALADTTTLQTDATEPCGIGSRYQGTFTAAFSRFELVIQPSGVDRFGLVVFYKSTTDFVAIESNDGSGAVAYNVRPVTVDAVNNWKMLRLAGPASKTSTTGVNLFAYAGSGGASKTISLGGVFAASERAVIPPHKVLRTTRYGSATYDPPSLNDGTGATTTVTVTGAALGNFARASFSLDLQGITLTAYVSAADTVAVRFQNESGGVLDLASGTLRVETQAPFA